MLHIISVNTLHKLLIYLFSYNEHSVKRVVQVVVLRRVGWSCLLHSKYSCH